MSTYTSILIKYCMCIYKFIIIQGKILYLASKFLKKTNKQKTPPFPWPIFQNYILGGFEYIEIELQNCLNE